MTPVPAFGNPRFWRSPFSLDTSRIKVTIVSKIGKKVYIAIATKDKIKLPLYLNSLYVLLFDIGSAGDMLA